MLEIGEIVCIYVAELYDSPHFFVRFSCTSLHWLPFSHVALTQPALPKPNHSSNTPLRLPVVGLYPCSVELCLLCHPAGVVGALQNSGAAAAPPTGCLAAFLRNKACGNTPILFCPLAPLAAQRRKVSPVYFNPTSIGCATLSAALSTSSDRQQSWIVVISSMIKSGRVYIAYASRPASGTRTSSSSPSLSLQHGSPVL